MTTDRQARGTLYLVPTPLDHGCEHQAPLADVVAHPAVRQRIEAVLDQMAHESTGSASRVARALLMAEPPSIDKGEITDKGSVNQRAVLKHREALVTALHDGTAPNILQPS